MIMDMNITLLKNRILWKVYLVWFVKKILPLIIFELLILTFAGYVLAKYIFVERVVGNTLIIAANHPWSLFYYLIYAFIKTSFLNKAGIIVVLSLGALLLRDIGRVIVSYRTTNQVTKPKP